MRKNQNAISEVIGIIMMVTIVVAIAALLNISVNGNFTNTLRSPAKVGIIQQDDTIFVANIQFGPVEKSEVTVLIKDSNNLPVELSNWWPSPTGDLKGGDFLTIQGAQINIKYTVSLAYKGSIIGKTSYVLTN